MLPDVGDVQERRALEPDLDESALHAGQNARDASLVDVADEAARAGALDVQLLHDRLLEHRDPRFLRRHVDQDLVRHRRLGGRCRARDVRARGRAGRYSTAAPAPARSAAVSASGSPMTPE
jgi:hypothetical protein